MYKVRGLFLLIIFLNCDNSGSTLRQDDQHIFPEMKNINYMKNVHTGNFKRFSFIQTDSVDVSKFDKGIRYQWFKSNYIGKFSLALENDHLKSKIHFGTAVSYDNFLVLKKGERIAGFPFGGHLIKLQKVYFDKKHRDSVYVFNSREVNTQDIDYMRNDSLELKGISFSKRRGFLKFLMREKSTNEIYLAQYYPELDKKK